MGAVDKRERFWKRCPHQPELTDKYIVWKLQRRAYNARGGKMHRIDNYILVGKKPVPVPDPIYWAKWFEGADRRVTEDTTEKHWISTVFLGLDHSWSTEGPPILFETMIFCKEHDCELNDYCLRMATWEESEVTHGRVTKCVWLYELFTEAGVKDE